MALIRSIALLSILLTGLAHADTCSSVAALGTITVTYPLDPAFILEQNQYWSTSCSSLIPSCIIFPKTVEEVATVVKILKNNSEPFAVKSGGHNPNSHFSSVAGGPLISTDYLEQANLDPATGIVDVGPGNRLDEIAAKLQGTGWTFVGGRIGNTGVGGLVLGGGLSYMSAQYGWSASSVKEYELVLANGTIAHVSATTHPDLYKALKGGGNIFGIVTNYKLQAYRQGNIHGGNLVFLQSPQTDAKILKAVRDFTEYNTDDKAAVIVTAERSTVDLIDSWILFLFYDGPVVPPGIFSNFTSIPVPVVNTFRQRTYADLMAFSNWVIVKASVVNIATETIPLPSSQNSVEVMETLHAHWRNVSGTTLTIPGIVASIAYQPFPKQIARQAIARSPDLIEADDSVDRLIIEMNYSFIPQSEYERMADTTEQTYSGVRERVLAWQADGTLPQAYLPLFMNYGFNRQDYFGRLKPENRALARRVASEVDPDGVFRTRTGGWRP